MSSHTPSDPDLDDFEPLIIPIDPDRAQEVAAALDSMGTVGYMHVLYTKPRTRYSPSGLERRRYSFEDIALGVIEQEWGFINVGAKGTPPQFEWKGVRGVYVHINEDEAVLFDIRFKGLMNYLMLETNDAQR